MMVKKISTFMALMALPLCAGARSGKATAEWITESTSCSAGGTLQTAIRLVLDDGWHTYWRNPGEGGMKPDFEWDLPAGWSASGPAYPVPERFRTGGLAGFGYAGTVVFPVTLTPPADFEGGTTLKARVSWLTCDDDACVPGDLELTLDLRAGTPAPTAEAEVIEGALLKIPRPQEEWLRLDVREKPDSLVLTIEVRGQRPLEMAGREIFPVTPNVIDPAADIRFANHGTQWVAEVPKSGYAQSPLKQLALVIAGKGSEAPIEVAWKAP